MLTASHVVADPPEIITSDPKGDDLPEPLVNQTFGTKPILVCAKDNEDAVRFASVGKVAYVDPYNDFAILELEREPSNEIQSSEFYTGKVRVGERVFTVGNTTLDANGLSSGIIQHTNRDPLADPSERKFIQTDCAGGPGLSGGGLFRAIDGKCIGIIIIKNEMGQCLYAMPITKIREVLSNSSRKDLTP